MRKSRVKKLAEIRGVTVQELLRELYELHGNQTAVAAQIGISQSRLSQIISENGLREKSILVDRSKCAS